MKKILLTLFCLSMLLKLIVAQSSYIPFPNPAYWRVDLVRNDPGPPACSSTYYFHYSTGNDTIINAKTYVKITRSPYIFSGSTNCFVGLIPGYVGALRDDTIAKKVFFIYQSENADSLLFDYNLNIGDTVKGILSPVYTYAFVVSIDSVLINAQYHKRWNLDYCSAGVPPYFYFIEGIGSNLGLIERFVCGAGVFSNLICVMDSTGSIFTGGSSPYGCQLITSTNSLRSEIETIKIIPNPVNAESRVILPDKNISGIRIINSIGAVVLNISEKQISDFKIKAENYTPGVYILIAYSKNETYSIKFIIQR